MTAAAPLPAAVVVVARWSAVALGRRMGTAAIGVGVAIAGGLDGGCELLGLDPPVAMSARWATILVLSLSYCSSSRR